MTIFFFSFYSFICSIEHLIRILPIGHNIIINDFSDEELKLFYQTIGNNVKQIRKEKKITQMQLALAIGHNSVGHIAKAELYKYDKHFNLEQLYKIAIVLEVSLHDIIPQ